jgi:hypothetical protein
MARTPVVTFDPQVRTQRRLREDERAVCTSWSRHAAKCGVCCNPVEVWRRGGQLCDRGRSYAIDLATYIYSKGGRPHSVIDKAHYGQRNEIEIPYEFDAVRDLVKAFDKGLTLNAYAKRPVTISQDKNYYVSQRQEVPTVVITSNSSSRREREKYDERRKSSHLDNYRGSHYYNDERARSRKHDEPVVIMVEPRHSSKYYR